MNNRGWLRDRRSYRRGTVAFTLSGLLLCALAFAATALRLGPDEARAEGDPGSREVTMHLIFPDSRDAGVLTVGLFLIDDSPDLSARVAEGKAAMLARFPGAIELTPSEVQAQYNINDNVRWPELGTNWSYNPSGVPSAMTAAAALTAITAGANGWTNAGGSGWKYNYDGQTTTASGCNGIPGEVPRDSQNVVSWGHIVSAGFWGYTCWWRGPQLVPGTSFFALQEFDIIFENSLAVPYTPNVLKALALHEFGHGLGLAHTEEAICPGHVMCAGSGATALQSLTADDIAGVVALYGVAPTPTATTKPTASPTPTPPLFPYGPKARSFLVGIARD